MYHISHIVRIVLGRIIAVSTLILISSGCGELADFRSQGQLLDIEELAASDPGGIAVETFFGNPEQTDFKLSPDGEYIAWLAPWNGRMNIHVENLEEGKPERITEETRSDLSHFFWANNKTLLFIQDKGGNEQFRLYAVDVTEGNTRDLTPFDNVQVEIISELPNEEDELIIAINKNNPRLFEPYKLNIVSGKMTQLAENSKLKEPVTWWMADHEGKLRVALSVKDGVNVNLLYRETEKDPFRKILSTDWTEYMQPLFFDFDNRYIYASSNLGRDCAAIVKFDPGTGKEVETVFEHDEVDVYDMGYSLERRKLTWIGFAHDKWHTVFLDSAAAHLYRRVKSSLGDAEVKVKSIDDAERKFVIRTYSDRSLGSWYLYDRISDKLEKLADVNAEIREDEMARMDPVSFTSRDGLTLHGYLTIPRGSDPHNLPVVVNPHGGPRNRNYWGFNSEVQFLASRGYAVLQINYRGSIGYGRKFANSGFGEWGGKIQDDISDGVLWLIDQGIADPDRIAIYGFSFGGYSALVGATVTPDLYRCAIDYSGITDLFTFIDSIPPMWEPYRDMIVQMVGDPGEDSAKLAYASPIRHLDKVKIPVFVVQGATDPRVSAIHTDLLVQGLLQEGVPVAYMLKEDEGHSLRKEENKLEFYRAMAGFLARYMPADLPQSES